MKGTLLLRPKQFFVRISPRITVGSLSNTTWYSLYMRYKQCDLGWSQSVMKGTFLVMPRQFFVLISPRITVGSLSDTTWYVLPMRYKQCNLGWSRWVMKGTLLLRSKQFFVHISPMIAVGSLSNTTWYAADDHVTFTFRTTALPQWTRHPTPEYSNLCSHHHNFCAIIHTVKFL
jgi:hypothetical protein